MSKIQVYLAGSCKNVSIEERNIWRNHIVEQLKDNSDVLVAFNPNEHFTYENNNAENEKLIMDFFLHRLNQCQVAVFNLNNSDKSIGTGIEFGYAIATNKFVIGFGNENIYDYMKEKCSAIFNDVDGVIDFLLEHWW